MRRPPFWATVLTFIGFVILCTLGTWQLQRLQWKEQLLADLTEELRRDPMDKELSTALLNQTDKPVLRGFAEGVFLHDKELQLGIRTYNGKPGYHILTPFETLQDDIILVNRGWIPVDTDDELIGRPKGALIVTGIARHADRPNPFTPENQPDEDLWYNIDTGQIADAKNIKQPAAYVLYADEDDSPDGLPIKQALIWEPPNNHLQYAVFWYLMALTLLVIYTLRFLRKGA